MKRRQKRSRNASPNSLSPEKIAEILAAALEVNSNASQVARQVGGVRQVTVWRYARAAGLKLEAGKAVQRRHAKPPEMRARIFAAPESNPNARAAARQVGAVVMLITPVRRCRPHTGCLNQSWAGETRVRPNASGIKATKQRLLTRHRIFCGTSSQNSS